MCVLFNCRSQWPRGRRRPFCCWIRMFESCSGHGYFYVVLSCVGRGLCGGLITIPEESYRVSVCVWSRNPERETKGPSWTLSVCEWVYYLICCCGNVYQVLYWCLRSRVRCRRIRWVSLHSSWSSCSQEQTSQLWVWTACWLSRRWRQDSAETGQEFPPSRTPRRRLSHFQPEIIRRTLLLTSMNRSDFSECSDI
jgi:hypothetical protein